MFHVHWLTIIVGLAGAVMRLLMVRLQSGALLYMGWVPIVVDLHPQLPVGVAVAALTVAGTLFSVMVFPTLVMLLVVATIALSFPLTCFCGKGFAASLAFFFFFLMLCITAS